MMVVAGSELERSRELRRYIQENQDLFLLDPCSDHYHYIPPGALHR